MPSRKTKRAPKSGWFDGIRPKGIAKITLIEARVLRNENCYHCMKHVAEAERRGQKSVYYNLENFHILSPEEVETSKQLGRF